MKKEEILFVDIYWNSDNFGNSFAIGWQKIGLKISFIKSNTFKIFNFSLILIFFLFPYQKLKAVC